jgi:LPS export ABC transporter permease LptG/LPS export ABC transporter permease LptF
MRILDRYISREVLSHSFLGLAVFTFVFFIPQLVRLMEVIVRHSSGSGSIGLLFLCSLAPVLAFTFPMATLVGVLIGLGRMSADSEIIALNACGIGLRRLLMPVGVLAAMSGILTLLVTLWLGPASIRELHALENEMITAEAPYAVQPRVFDERFPRLVLYVQDVDSSSTKWHGVFLAEADPSTGDSRVTLADNAIVTPGATSGGFDMHFGAGTTHEMDLDSPAQYNVTTFGSSDLPVQTTSLARPASSLSDSERPMHDLIAVARTGSPTARTELQRRFAFPAACLIFAFLGVPVGVRPRRGGRAAGFILTLALISIYYFIFVAGAHYAQIGAVPAWLGVWSANAVCALLALLFLTQIEQTHRYGWLARLSDWPIFRGRTPGAIDEPESSAFSDPFSDASPRSVVSITSASTASNGRTRSRLFLRRTEGGFPLLMDVYILRTFFYFFAILLAGFIVIFDAFTLFDLLGDIARNHIPFLTVVNYFRFLIPLMVYRLVPLAALVATLVSLGNLAKNNESTAFKASGVSLYRLCFPLILAGVILALGMFLLDDTFLPRATQRQDALRNLIKGKPAQTYFHPTHEWIFGENMKVFNYRVYDPDQNLFGGISIFELDPNTFQMRRRVYANRARWERDLNAWILESGWVRDFSGDRVTRYAPFNVLSLPEFREAPSYFNREVRQSYQMNWSQLSAYIRALRQAGFETAQLTVQWHEKFAFPLIAAIIVFLGAPFAFLVGTRGAVGGLALAVGIGIAYWATSALFEAMGAVGQLPPLLAGWAPDGIFFFLGAYFFLKMPT